jgi:hypothetical protein
MSADEGVRVPFHPEFKSALEKLHKLLAGALWDVKLNTCSAAWSEVKRARSAKKKIEIVSRQFEQWKEDSVKTVREWLPKFAQLGAAHPEAIHGELIQWTKDNIWKTVEGQCGIGPAKEGNWSHDRVNPVTIYWFAVASQGNVAVNMPTVKPWCAPRWLAADRRETNALLEKRTGELWLRLSYVMDEALDLVEIQRAISRRDVAIPPAGSLKNVNASLGTTQTSSGVWRDVENRFRDLEREGGKRLSADWYSTAWPETGQHWNLKGTNKLIRQRFEWIAQNAALKLGHADVSTGLFFWLDLLKRDSPGFHIDVQSSSKLPNGSLVRSEGGIIHRICTASADYCLKLENDEVARSMLEKLNSPSSSQRTGSRKPGRSPRLALDFVTFAGMLWLKAERQVVASQQVTRALPRVTLEKLTVIAASLDGKGYVPPAKYLEKTSARELRKYNSRHSNSKNGTIVTWVRLVSVADKDHLRGMRRLLSRCAKKMSSQDFLIVRK